MSDTNSEFFREIEEELHLERMRGLWQRFAGPLVAAAVLLVVGVAAWQGWKAWTAHQERVDGERFAVALSLAAAGQTDQAATAFADLAQHAHSGYAVLARLQEAALLRRKEPAQAAGAYDSLASGEHGDLSKAALLLWALDRFDHVDPRQVISRLAPLTAADSPWRFSALEITALAQAKAGHGEAAKAMFGKLAADPAAPADLRARAGQMIAALDN